MNITHYFLKKPVLAIAISMMLLLVGLIGFHQIPVRLYPRIIENKITITTIYTGASSAVMQNNVTHVLEKSLSGFDDINYMTASNTLGTSVINLILQPGISAQKVEAQVLSKISSVRDVLPAGMMDPVISTTQNDAAMILAFTDQNQSQEATGDFLRRQIEPQLEGINGVSSADVKGGVYALHIWLNPDKMSSLGVTVNDVTKVLPEQNAISSSGEFKGENSELPIEMNSALSSVDQFKKIIIRQTKTGAITLSDIATINWGSHSNNVSAFYNGKPTTVMFIQLDNKANPLEVLPKVRAKLLTLKSIFPTGLKSHEVVNNSLFISASVHEVLKSLLIAILIVSLVIYLFIANLRSLVILLVAIPLSLIGVCAILWFFDCSINALTLLAMVIAIGLVVDDAIVVLENIHRHHELGLSAVDAAIEGSKEILVPIIAMTITLAAVYLPICFSTGITAELFTEFAIALAGSVIISGIIALVLSPYMCFKSLSADLTKPRWSFQVDKILNNLKEKYHAILHYLLKKHQKTILVIWAGILLSTIGLYACLPSELAPKEDEGYVMLFGKTPDSTNLHFIESNTDKLNAIFNKFPEISGYAYLNGIPGSHEMIAYAKLIPWNLRTKTAMQLQNELQQKVWPMVGMSTYALVPSSLPGSDNMPVEFVISTSGSYLKLYNIAQQLVEKANQSGLFLFTQSDLHYDTPTLQIHINRDQISQSGIAISDLENTLNIFLSGDRFQNVTHNGKNYDVILQVPAMFRASQSSLDQFYVRNTSGTLFPLSDLVITQIKTEPSERNEFQREKSVVISGVMRNHESLSTGLNYLTTSANKLMTSKMHSSTTGESRQFLQERGHMIWIFLVALFCIYWILAVQFNSFVDPWIILSGSAPAALFAGLLSATLGGITINIYSQVALLTLIGLISKHGILMVRFANELRLEKFSSCQDAILEAAKQRLRPILMTTAAMTVGVLPLVFAIGAGSNSRFEIGTILLGGMFFGTIMTLTLIPVLYSCWKNK